MYEKVTNQKRELPQKNELGLTGDYFNQITVAMSIYMDFGIDQALEVIREYPPKNYLDIYGMYDDAVTPKTIDRILSLDFVVSQLKELSQTQKPSKETSKKFESLINEIYIQVAGKPYFGQIDRESNEAVVYFYQLKKNFEKI